MTDLQKKLSDIRSEMEEFFLERESEIALIQCASLSGTNVYFVGVPGTAKTAVCRDWSRRITGSYFFGTSCHPQMPSDAIIGPASAKGLMNDEYRYVTKGRMPESHFSYIGEIGRCNPTTLDSLLNMMNPDERTFFSEGIETETPIQSVFCDSNSLLSEDENLGALWDRLTIRKEVRDLQNIENVIGVLKGNGAKKLNSPTTITIDELKEAREAVSKMKIKPEVWDAIEEIAIQLRVNGFHVSTRTWNTIAGCARKGRRRTSLIRAWAYLEGADSVGKEHLTVMRHTIWNRPSESVTIARIVNKIACPEAYSALAIEDSVEEYLGTWRARTVHSSEEIELEEKKYKELEVSASALKTHSEVSAVMRKIVSAKAEVLRAGRIR